MRPKVVLLEILVSNGITICAAAKLAENHRASRYSVPNDQITWRLPCFTRPNVRIFALVLALRWRQSRKNEQSFSITHWIWVVYVIIHRQTRHSDRPVDAMCEKHGFRPPIACFYVFNCFEATRSKSRSFSSALQSARDGVCRTTKQHWQSILGRPAIDLVHILEL
jgi:hypothetical protein